MLTDCSAACCRAYINNSKYTNLDLILLQKMPRHRREAMAAQCADNTVAEKPMENTYDEPACYTYINNT